MDPFKTPRTNNTRSKAFTDVASTEVASTEVASTEVDWTDVNLATRTSPEEVVDKIAGAMMKFSDRTGRMITDVESYRAFINKASNDAYFKPALVAACEKLAKTDGLTELIQLSAEEAFEKRSSLVSDKSESGQKQLRRYYLLKFLVGKSGKNFDPIAAKKKITKTKWEQYGKEFVLILREAAMLPENAEERNTLLCCVAFFLICGGLLTESFEKNEPVDKPRHCRKGEKYEDLVRNCGLRPVPVIRDDDQFDLDAKERAIRLILFIFFDHNECAAPLVKRLYAFYKKLAKIKVSDPEAYDKLNPMRKMFSLNVLLEGDDDDVVSPSLAAAAASSENKATRASAGQTKDAGTSAALAIKNLSDHEKALIKALWDQAKSPSQVDIRRFSVVALYADEIFPGHRISYQAVYSKFGTPLATKHLGNRNAPCFLTENAQQLVDALISFFQSEESVHKDHLASLMKAADKHFGISNPGLFDLLVASELLESVEGTLDQFEVGKTTQDILQFLSQKSSPLQKRAPESNNEAELELFDRIINDALKGMVTRDGSAMDHAEEAKQFDQNYPGLQCHATMAAHMLLRQGQAVFEKHSIDAKTLEDWHQFVEQPSATPAASQSGMATTQHAISPASTFSSPSYLSSPGDESQGSTETEVVPLPRPTFTTPGMMRNEYLYKFLAPDKNEWYPLSSKNEETKETQETQQPYFTEELRGILAAKRCDKPKPEESAQLAEAGYAIRQGDLSFLRLLGHGKFAGVFLAKCVSTGKLVVVKPEFYTSVQVGDYFLRVMESHSSVEYHESVMGLEGFLVWLIDGKVVTVRNHKKEKCLLIATVLEYCPGGIFDDQIEIHRENGTLTIKWVCKLALAIVEALIVFDEKKVVHRDLKGENILMFDGDTPKIGDFGVGRGFTTLKGPSQQPGTLQVGTPGYICEEGMKGNYDSKNDVYAFGKVLHGIGDIPTYEDSDEDAAQEFEDLIGDMTNEIHDDRISVDKVEKKLKDILETLG